MVLTVGQDRQFQHAAILHGAAHQAGIHDWHAIVRQADNAGLMHPPNLGQFLPGQAHRDCANREETGATYRRRSPQHKLRDGWRIIDWFGIRHRGHGGKPAGRGRRQSRGNGFLIFETRLTEMDVHVKEARCDHAALGFDDAWCRARVVRGMLQRGTNVRTQFNNFTVRNPYVQMPIDPLGWINDPSATNEDVHLNSLQEQIQQRHADGHAVGHLRENHRLEPIRHLWRNLHAAVHGPWMHHEHAGLGASQTFSSEWPRPSTHSQRQRSKRCMPSASPGPTGRVCQRSRTSEIRRAAVGATLAEMTAALDLREPVSVVVPPRPIRPDQIALRQQACLWSGKVKHGNLWTTELTTRLVDLLAVGDDDELMTVATGTAALRLAYEAAVGRQANGDMAALPAAPRSLRRPSRCCRWATAWIRRRRPRHLEPRRRPSTTPWPRATSRWP